VVVLSMIDQEGNRKHNRKQSYCLQRCWLLVTCGLRIIILDFGMIHIPCLVTTVITTQVITVLILSHSLDGLTVAVLA